MVQGKHNCWPFSKIECINRYDYVSLTLTYKQNSKVTILNSYWEKSSYLKFIHKIDELCWTATWSKGNKRVTVFQNHVLITVSFYQPIYFLHSEVKSPVMKSTWILHSIGGFHSGITFMDITFSCNDFIINNNGVFCDR